MFSILLNTVIRGATFNLIPFSSQCSPYVCSKTSKVIGLYLGTVRILLITRCGLFISKNMIKYGRVLFPT